MVARMYKSSIWEAEAVWVSLKKKILIAVLLQIVWKDSLWDPQFI